MLETAHRRHRELIESKHEDGNVANPHRRPPLFVHNIGAKNDASRDVIIIRSLRHDESHTLACYDKEHRQQRGDRFVGWGGGGVSLIVHPQILPSWVVT